MIKCHFHKFLGEKRLKISDVARATGIDRGTLTRLYYEEATRIDLSVLDQLCEFLNCTVGDLFEHIGTPEKPAED